jgi:hypothetical protein
MIKVLSLVIIAAVNAVRHVSSVARRMLQDEGARKLGRIIKFFRRLHSKGDSGTYRLQVGVRS